MSARPIPKFTINLLPSFQFEKKPLGKLLKWALTFGRYIVIFTELIVLSAFFSRFYFDARLTDLHESIAEKQAIIESAKDLEQKIKILKRNLSLIKNLEEKEEPYPAILKSLAGIMPEDVVLENVNFNPGEISFSASAYSISGLNTFLKNLKSSQKFIAVSLVSISKGKTEERGIKFNVAMKPQILAFK